MQDIRQRLLATFQLEHRDHVEQIRSLLAMVQSTGVQPAARELDEVFRRAHSLKGAARAVDLNAIEQLAHRLETLFSRVRKGSCTLDDRVTTVVQQVLDASEDFIVGSADNQAVASVPEALKAMDRILQIEPSPVAEQATHPAAATSAVEPPTDSPELQAPAFQPVETVRITKQNFEGLFRSAAGLATQTQRQDEVAAKLDVLVQAIALIRQESERIRQLAAKASSGSSHAHFVALLDPMQRQLRDISRQANTTRRLHQRHSWSLRQLGKQLQQDIGRARMIPAESLIEGHRKMVRDLAREEGKEIEFQASSAGIHADRRVLEALKDPILHILRNAISHGLESPDERRCRNKAPVGRLTFRVDTNGQRLNIVIEDDGRGIDFRRVSELAVREGIVSETAAANSSTEDLARILFRAGFSTARAVTNLSGRGMGLSVVYESIRKLQGDLEIRPLSGGGTTVSLSVPLTIATHKLLLIQSGEQVFAIPLSGIESLQRVRVTQIATMEGKPVLRLNRHPAPVPLATMQSLLGLDHASRRSDPDHLQIVILRSGGRRIALAVDAVLKETEAQLHDLGPATGCDGKIASGVILDDGGVAFLLNPFELVESALAGNFTASAWSLQQAPEPLPVAKPASILVVDDSPTTRELEKNILEAQGYAVRVASDGLQALALLRQEKPDLVISDIEMPSLNGFGLVEAIKANREWARVPVIIVSSVERREDQERGLALGADAYVIKGRFDQTELLATIQQLI